MGWLVTANDLRGQELHPLPGEQGSENIRIISHLLGSALSPTCWEEARTSRSSKSFHAPTCTSVEVIPRPLRDADPGRLPA